MFDKIFGNFEERQAEIREKLSGIELETEVADGGIKIKANAIRQIKDITIDKKFLNPESKKELEDLLMVALNEIITMATEAEAEESKNLVKDMLPPGLGGLSNLFS